MSQIIRYCKLEEEHSGENAFDVSRPNVLGNPYTHIKNKQTLAEVKVATRDEAIDLYSEYFDKMMTDESEFGEIFMPELDSMYESYKSYDVIDIV